MILSYLSKGDVGFIMSRLHVLIITRYGGNSLDDC